MTSWFGVGLDCGFVGVVCLRTSAAKAVGVFVVGCGTAEAVPLSKTCRDRARLVSCRTGEGWIPKQKANTEILSVAQNDG